MAKYQVRPNHRIVSQLINIHELCIVSVCHYAALKSLWLNRTIEINFGLRLRSSKTKSLRPSACRHFKILCKLALKPESVLRSNSYQKVKSPIILPSLSSCVKRDIKPYSIYRHRHYPVSWHQCISALTSFLFTYQFTPPNFSFYRQVCVFWKLNLYMFMLTL